MAKKTKLEQFVICISNEGCDDLEIWKLYRLLPDESATLDNFIRVVDESGEDYLYPSERFVMVELPRSVVKRLLTPATSQGA